MEMISCNRNFRETCSGDIVAEFLRKWSYRLETKLCPITKAEYVMMKIISTRGYKSKCNAPDVLILRLGCVSRGG